MCRGQGWLPFSPRAWPLTVCVSPSTTQEEAITRTLSDLGLAYLDLVRVQPMLQQGSVVGYTRGVRHLPLFFLLSFILALVCDATRVEQCCANPTPTPRAQYLIHFPIPLRYVDPSVRYPPEWMYDPLEKRMHEDPVPLADTWRAMAALKAKGLARHIGVCNFSTPLLRDLAHAVPESPVEVLQVELHPFLVQEKLVRFCKERGIVVTAFSPLGASSYVPLGMATAADSALVAPTVVAIATRLGVTPAQVLLGWASHRGLSAIPKSSSVERMKENLAGADVAITDADAAAIAALDQHRRYNDPGVFAERFFGSFAPIYD